MGSIYRRGKIYWIQYYGGGQLFRESSRSHLREVARSLLRKREGDIVDGRLPARNAERTTYEDLQRLYLQDYEINGRKSIRRARQLASQLARDFSGVNAGQITSQRIADYIERRKREGIANGTINRELAALKRMFHLAAQQTPPLVLSTPHIPHLHENNVRTGFLTEEDYKVLRAALPDHIKVPFIIAYWTGMRASEILSLTWEQVDLEAGFLGLEPGTTKNGQGRAIPCTCEVKLILRLWKDQTGLRYPHCPWVCHYRGKRLQAIPKKAWRAVCGKVGLKGKLFHDLRRTAIRNMVRAGVTERVAMAISGHCTRSVFDRYNITSNADLARAVELLEKADRSYFDISPSYGGLQSIPYLRH